MHAVRNIKLCTKDCLCLYVCPTGATDTEDGQIDAKKCISGCRLCVDACPSHAIFLVPDKFPPQQKKTNVVKSVLQTLVKSKTEQEQIAKSIASKSKEPIERQLATAISISNKLMAEDLLRESGYMLPQSKNVEELLQSLLNTKQANGFPKEAIEKLLVSINKINEKEIGNMKKTTTQENLMEAFAGESQANRKYLAYAKKAEKDGSINAAKLFMAASDAETLHALKEFEVAGKIKTTAENLKDAVAGETHEYKEMYPEFIKTAKEEGNKDAVRIFTLAMKAEEVHARLYKEALENLDNKDEVFYYLCPLCGNVEKVIPGKCSICGVSGDKFIKY